MRKEVTCISVCLSVCLFMPVISDCTNWILMAHEGLLCKFNANLILIWLCSQYHVRWDSCDPEISSGRCHSYRQHNSLYGTERYMVYMSHLTAQNPLSSAALRVRHCAFFQTVSFVFHVIFTWSSSFLSIYCTTWLVLQQTCE